MTTRTATAWPMYGASAVVAAGLALSNMPTPFYAHWRTELGLTPSIVTLLFSAYILALLFALALAGSLAGRLGGKRVLLAGMLLVFVASLLFAVPATATTLLAARALSGLGIGAVLAAGLPWITAAGGSGRGRLPMALASAAVAAGAGVGPILSGTVAHLAAEPVRTAFLGEAALVGSAVLLTLALPSLDATGPSAARISSLTRNEMRHIGQGVASFGCALGATAFILSLGPSVLKEVTGVGGPLVAGAIASSMFLVGALVQLPGRRLSTDGAFAAAGSSTVLGATAMALAVTTGSVLPLVVSALFAGIGYGLAQLAGLTVIVDRVDGSRRALATATLNIGGYVPCGLLPILAGLVADRVGIAGAALVFAAVIAALTITATWLILRWRRAESVPS